MTESPLHRRMKRIVTKELEGERYALMEEPLFPPSRRVSWKAYRPDLLGYRREDGEEQLVVTECETHPNMKRFAAKNIASLSFQPFLFQRGSIRRILAVPQGKLKSVDLGIRTKWEVWVLGSTRPMVKIGVAGAVEDSFRTREQEVAATVP